jgi:hypothetical protein
MILVMGSVPSGSGVQTRENGPRELSSHFGEGEKWMELGHRWPSSSPEISRQNASTWPPVGKATCKTNGFPRVFCTLAKRGGGGSGQKCGFLEENAGSYGQRGLKRCQKVAKRIENGAKSCGSHRIRSQKRPKAATRVSGAIQAPRERPRPLFRSGQTRC